ncbi:MAG: hypothetical protein ACP5OS_07510 [Leptospirillia bacterium]
MSWRPIPKSWPKTLRRPNARPGRPSRWRKECGPHLWEEICLLALVWCEGSKLAEKEAEATVKEIWRRLPEASPTFVSLHAETALAAGLWEKAVDAARFGREEARRTGTLLFDPLFRIVEGKAHPGIDPRMGVEEARNEARNGGTPV